MAEIGVSDRYLILKDLETELCFSMRTETPKIFGNWGEIGPSAIPEWNLLQNIFILAYGKSFSWEEF